MWQIVAGDGWSLSGCFMHALLRPLKVVLNGFGVARSLFIALLGVLRS